MSFIFGLLSGRNCNCKNAEFVYVGQELRCINCLKTRNPSTPLTVENFSQLKESSEVLEETEESGNGVVATPRISYRGHEEDLIAAANRTTHAVRAFVLFLFYQLSAITTAAVLYILAILMGNQSNECEPNLRQYGACEPQPFLLILALIVWISGVIYSSKVGWEEIRKSEV